MSEGKLHPDEAPPSYVDATNGPNPQYPVTTAPSSPPGAPPQANYMPPPQQQYSPPQPQMHPAQTTVIVSTSKLGQTSVQMQCPTCNALIMTETEYKIGGMVWLICGIIFIVGCWAGCCLIPFCIDELKDVRHSCPNCHQHIGTYHRLS
ncbi:lipopolysaccharide-induced tumor necrosis factor-alpha factor homolog [Lineus longissimus]|uniref:lipopolysaccharide-induced tumor necrosis factor-alpha factor homolog n=1 Tax=Lineus longissimus TaxID=88925 RepID=UPI002B4D52CE